MAKNVAVRYGAMETVEPMSAPEEPFHLGEAVIVRTERGVEWGVVVTTRPGSESAAPKGEILRRATDQDFQKYRDLTDNQEEDEYRACRELITQYALPMKLVRVEHLFGGNKITFFFLADGRVDFRKLVKDLAKRYRTRIEMRQIGVRDETRMLGEYGPCGRDLCCRAFLRTLKPIPMKVAKSQKSTLDPAKISGRCGRLKCCLKFEDELYSELKRNLPRRGATVATPIGEGIVVGYHVINQTVNVRFPDDTEQTLPLDDVEMVETPGENENES